MPFNMSPQRTWSRASEVTLAAFAWLFSTVYFQMCPQSACIRGCIITLATFVWFFSTVRFKMPPQSASLNWYNITRFSPYSVPREWILKFRGVKSEKKQIPFTFSEKWKVKWKFGSLFSRMKSEMKMPRDREVKFLENSREILQN